MQVLFRPLIFDIANVDSLLETIKRKPRRREEKKNEEEKKINDNNNEMRLKEKGQESFAIKCGCYMISMNSNGMST